MCSPASDATGHAARPGAPGRTGCRTEANASTPASPAEPPRDSRPQQRAQRHGLEQRRVHQARRAFVPPGLETSLGETTPVTRLQRVPASAATTGRIRASRSERCRPPRQRLDGVCVLPSRPSLTGCRTLRVDIHGIQRLPGSHEETISLGPAERHVGAHFGQTDPADQLALR